MTAGTDNTQLILGRQVSPTDGGDLRTPVAAVRVTGTASASESSGTITITGLSSGTIAADAMVHVTGFPVGSPFNGFFEVVAERTGTNDLALRGPAGTRGVVAANSVAGVEVGTLAPFRRSGDSFQPVLNKQPSDEIVPNRGIGDVVRLGQGAQGSVNSRVILQNLGPMFQSVFLNDWTYNGTNVRTGSTAVVAFDSSGTVSETGIGGDFSVGDAFKIVDSGGQNDGKFVIVTAVTANDVTVIGDTLVAEGSRNPEFILGDVITPGIKQLPFTAEKRYNDITGADEHFPRFVGCLPGSLSISGSANSPLQLSVQFVSADEIAPTPTTSLGTPTLRPTGSELNTIDDAQAWIDGVGNGRVRDFSLSISNNLSPQAVWGERGAPSVAVRGLDVTGSFTRYYANTAIYDKAVADETIPVAMPLVSPDAGGPRYIFYMQRCDLSAPNRNGGGRNTDVFLSAGYTGLIDESLGYTIALWRVMG